MNFDFKKHQVDIGIYVGLFLMSLTGAFLLSKSIPRNLGQVNSTQVDPSQYIGVVKHIKNDVRWKPGGEISWTDLFSDHGLNYEDQIYIGEGSGATIEAKGFKAQILENTLFTFTQRKNELAFVFDRGMMEVEMHESQPIALEVGNQTIRMKGNSRVLIQRTPPPPIEDAPASENIGVSILAGEAKMITPSGRAIPTKEGQAFAILPGEKDKGPKFKSMHIQVDEGQKDKVFFANEKLDLGWNAKARKFKSIDVQISSEKDFSKIIVDKKSNGDSLEMPSLPPGKYYWRVKGDTGLAKVFGPVASFNVVTDVIPKQHAPEIRFAKPGEWDVKVKAMPVEVADVFEYEVAADEKFQKVISRKKSTQFIESLPVQKEGEVFTRVRFKYKGRDRYSPWSLLQTAETPSFVDAPLLEAVEPKSGTDYALKWSPLGEVQFYQVFQTSIDTAKNSRFYAEKNSLKLRALTRMPSEVYVRGHKSEKVFGFNSNRISLKGFVDRPRIRSHEILPRWLERFNENEMATLNLKLEMGLQENEQVSIEVADNAEFKDSVSFETRSAQISREVPVWRDYFIRARILVDTDKYFTYPSEVAQNYYPEVPNLQAPELKLPRNFENIVILTQNPNVLFAWIPFDEKVEYDFELALDKDFKRVMYKNIVSGRQFVLPKKLASGDYFWRLRSFNKVSQSPWSTVFGVSILNGK